MATPLQPVGPASQRICEHAQEYCCGAESLFHSLNRIGLVAHANVRSSEILSGKSMACLAQRTGKLRIMIPPSNVMPLDSNLAPAQQTAVLLLAPGTPPCSLNWIFVHHDDDSGTA